MLGAPLSGLPSAASSHLYDRRRRCLLLALVRADGSMGLPDLGRVFFVFGVFRSFVSVSCVRRRARVSIESGLLCSVARYLASTRPTCRCAR